MLKNSKNAYNKQQSAQLTFQDIFQIIAKQTGFNPKLSGKSYIARCPSHNDKQASLSITQGSNGIILFYCHAGCSLADVCDAVGIKIKDLFPPKTRGAR